jgi:hypothetical protein
MAAAWISGTVLLPRAAGSPIGSDQVASALV